MPIDFRTDDVPLAECVDCNERFPYGAGTPTRVLGYCPACGSYRWMRWGRRIDGEDHEYDHFGR